MIAVSGGMDSVCLLACCVALARLLKLTLEVAHVDHRFRKGSAKDLKFVAKLSKKYALPFHSKTLDKPPPNTNLEAFGRKERYKFFAATIKARRLDYVLTAHTADDVAETFLMRLITNKELRSIQMRDEKRRCLRPVLSVSRQEIERYVKQHGLKFSHDPSNDKLDFLRNRVRHALIPFLRENFDKRIAEVLYARAHAVAEDLEILDSLVKETVGRIARHRFGSKLWSVKLRDELLQLNESLRWRVVDRIFLNKLGFNLGRKQSRGVIKMVLGETKGFMLPGSLYLSRSRDCVKLSEVH